MMGGDEMLVDEPHVVARIAQDEAVTRLKRLFLPVGKKESPGFAWDFFQKKIVEALTDDKYGFGVVGKTALRLLGYHIPNYLDAGRHDDDSSALWLFQKAMGLKPDSIPGPRTRKALLERLHDRGALMVPKQTRAYVRSPRGTVHAQVGSRTLCGLSPTEDWLTTTARINRCTTCERMSSAT
jgi:hypothetical protein